MRIWAGLALSLLVAACFEKGPSAMKTTETRYSYHCLFPYEKVGNVGRRVTLYRDSREIFSSEVGDNVLTGAPAALRDLTSEERFVKLAVRVDEGGVQDFEVDLEKGPVLSFHVDPLAPRVRLSQEREERGYD